MSHSASSNTDSNDVLHSPQAESHFSERLAAWERARFAPPPEPPLNPVTPTAP